VVENLKTTKYRNGDPIPNITDATEWGNLSTGAYCDFDNTPGNSIIYGKLYNWYSVDDSRNIAPTGWHVPTDAEWATLENFVAANLGASGSLAKALASTTAWASSTGEGAVGNDLTKNNCTGFSALPGGIRLGNGEFLDDGRYGAWWSSTDLYSSYTSDRSLSESYGDLFSYGSNKEDGLSVRCVKDN
jgi:uncharacterized protein (TIGR02145 family)